MLDDRLEQKKVRKTTKTDNFINMLDVPLNVTVQLGKSELLVKDILPLGEGSIIILDRLAGSPLDILVNGKLFARGDVVVIDETFSVRISEIVDKMEAINE